MRNDELGDGWGVYRVEDDDIREIRFLYFCTENNS